LSNTGGSTLDITSIPNKAGDFSTTTTCGATLTAGASCTISITFTPTAAGTHATTLDIINSIGTNSVTLTGSGTVSADSIAVDQTNSNKVYAALDGGGLFHSTDGADNWTAATQPEPVNKRTKAVIIKPDTPAKLFAATIGDGVLYSTDSGVNWTVCANTGLTSKNVYSLNIDPNSGKLYAGTDAGIYISSNDCIDWTAKNSGLTN
jgi:ligand-binding sensor domain-containing protein